MYGQITKIVSLPIPKQSKKLEAKTGSLWETYYCYIIIILIESKTDNKPVL